MNRIVIIVLIVAAFLIATTPIANAAFTGTEVYLASIGGGPGAGGSQWYTTIWVHNPTSSPALVQFTLLHRNQTNPAPIDVFSDTVPPGDTRRFDNAVRTMFGLESAFGAIRAVSDERLLINSRIYNLPAGSEEKDSVGQFFSAVPAEFAIGAGQTTELLGVYQTRPPDDSQFRYNFGFVETVGANVTVRVTAYDASGVSLAERTYSLGPFEARQYPFKNQFSDVSSTNVRLRVDIVSGSGRVVAFGSGLANNTDDPSTFEMSFRDDLLANGQQGGGTITGITAGKGLTGGGNEGRVTLDVGAGAGINVGDNTIAVADGGVTTNKIANSAVTTLKLAEGAVTSTKITNAAITTEKLNNGAVTREKISDDAVDETKIANNAVTTVKVIDKAITRGKLEDGAVNGSKIANGSVDTEDLAADAVTTDKINDGAVQTEDIATAAVTSEKIGNLEVKTADLGNGAVTGAKVSVPLTMSGGSTKVLDLSNSSAGGIAGATLRATNTSSGGGIAGYLESNGTDSTVVIKNDGSGVLMKGFGSNGGEEEIRIAHNGTVRIYDSAHSNVIALDASNGRGTFRDLRVTGHADATLPIAYAFIEGSNAEVRSGTSNVSCTWNAAGERYEITIAGENYYYRDYQTMVTPSTGSLARFAVSNSSGGKLTVIIFDLAGNKVKNDFQFVTFKGP